MAYISLGLDTTAALDPNAMKSAGYTFVCRYLSNSSWKNLIMGSSPYDTELKRYLNAGVSVVFNWEATGHMTTTNHPGDPYGQGREDAQRAQDQASRMGYPNAPIYFSIDYDVQPAEYAALRSYFQAIIDVIGKPRVGAYGGYYVLTHLTDNNLITYRWQTLGWSTVGGVKYTQRGDLHMLQRIGTVTVSGSACDVDEQRQTDFGQIPRPGVVVPPPPPPPPTPAPTPSTPGTLPSGNYGGTNLSSTQTTNATQIIRDAKGRNKSDNVCIAMICAALQEASLLNLNYGTGSSLGIFQLIAAHGTAAQRMNIDFSAGWWMDQADIKAPVPKQDTMAPDALAQLVEVSGNASAYTKWVATGRALVSAYNAMNPIVVPQPPPPPAPVPDPTPAPVVTPTPDLPPPSTDPSVPPNVPSSPNYPGRVVQSKPEFTSYTPEAALFSIGALQDTSGWSLSPYAAQSLRLSSSVTYRIVAYPASGGVRYDLPFADGSVTYDAGQSVGRRSAKLTISDPTLWPITSDSTLAPMGTEISIQYGFVLPNGTTEWIPLIRGPITDVGRSFPYDSSAAISVTVKDRSVLVDDDKFDTPRTTDTTETIVNAIIRLIRETLPSVTVTDYTGNTALCPQADLQQDRWGSVVKLGDSIGAEVYADRLGNFVIRNQATLRNAPRWLVNAGVDGVLTKATLGYSRTPVYNRAYVSGQSTTQTTTDTGGGSTTTNTVPPFAVAVDDDPNHASYYGGPFGKKTRSFVSPLVTSMQQAQLYANALLARVQGGYATVSLEHVPNPALDPGDVVTVSLDAMTSELHIIDSMTIPLNPTATQNLATRVEALPPQSTSNDVLAPPVFT